MNIPKPLRIVLMLLIAAALLVWPQFMKSYGLYLISYWLIFVIAVMGLNLTVGYAGQKSLGHAAFYGIGAYVSALVSLHWHFPFLAAALAALVVACPRAVEGAGRAVAAGLARRLGFKLRLGPPSRIGLPPHLTPFRLVARAGPGRPPRSPAQPCRAFEPVPGPAGRRNGPESGAGRRNGPESGAAERPGISAPAVRKGAGGSCPDPGGQGLP